METGLFLRLFRRFSRPSQEDLDRKNFIRQHGAKLMRLREMEEWLDLKLVKESFQQNAAMTSVSTFASDKDRFQAAVQWTCIENFFEEVDRRIAAGEKVERELSEKVRK